MPQPGQHWQAVGFEAVRTFSLILMIVNLADGPKLNGPFVPLRRCPRRAGPADGAPLLVRN